MDKFKYAIGDKVRVTNIGSQYSSYKEKYQEFNMFPNSNTMYPRNGDILVVTHQGRSDKGKLLYGIKGIVDSPIKSGKHTIIGEDGIELYCPVVRPVLSDVYWTYLAQDKTWKWINAEKTIAVLKLSMDELVTDNIESIPGRILATNEISVNSKLKTFKFISCGDYAAHYAYENNNNLKIELDLTFKTKK